MKDTVTKPIDQASAAREMLSMLRLLAIQGLVPNGREQVERWESALNHGEPGPGRLAMIRGLIEEHGQSLYEVGQTRDLIEQIANIATGARSRSGTEADGSGWLTPGDLAVVVDALGVASDELRDLAEDCTHCDPGPESPLCPECESRMDRADQFESLAAKLGSAR